MNPVAPLPNGTPERTQDKSPHKMLTSWWTPKILLLLSFVTLLIVLIHDAGRPSVPWKHTELLGDNPDSDTPPAAFAWYNTVSHYLVLWLVLTIPSFILGMIRRSGRLPLLGVSLFFLALIVLILPADLIKNWTAMNDLTSGELPSRSAYFWKLALLTIALLIPPVTLWWYNRQKILLRYVTRSLILPLLFCLLAFIAIWLLMDLGDNFADYRSKNAGIIQIAEIYLVQIPMLLVEVLPVALLLATLYSLGKLSRSNELTAMMSTGQSILTIIKPYLLASSLSTLFCLILNYHWAPRAAGMNESLVDTLGKETTGQARFKDHLYPNTKDGRMWYLGRVPFDLNLPFHDVMLFEIDKNDNITSITEAHAARWVPQHKHWVFATGRRVKFPPLTDKSHSETARMFGSAPPGKTNSYIVRTDLTETPWQILSSTLKPDQLSVPELISYHNANVSKSTEKQLAPYRTHFWLRFALPFKSLVLVLIATPLGIVLSRRGFLGGIAACIGIFFVLLFMENLFLNLGISGNLPPFLAAWTPYVATAIAGCVLLHYRIQQKNLPTLNTLKWFQKPIHP